MLRASGWLLPSRPFRTLGPYAVTKGRIQIALDFDPDMPVVLCNARPKESVKKVLITLIRHVLRKPGADPEYTGTAQPAS